MSVLNSIKLSTVPADYTNLCGFINKKPFYFNYFTIDVLFQLFLRFISILSSQHIMYGVISNTTHAIYTNTI